MAHPTADARTAKNIPAIALIALVLVGGLGAVAWAVMTNDASGQRARLPTVVSTAPATPMTPHAATIVDAPQVDPPVRKPPPLKPVRRAPKNPLSVNMQAALAVPGAEKHFFVDVATIRDSAPGQAVLKCLPRHLRRELSDLKEKAGFEPLTQVRRVGMVERLAVVEGDFAGVDWMQLNPRFTHERRDGIERYAEGDRLFAVLEDQQLLAGTTADVEAAIARIQSGDTADAPLPVGDVNGTLPLRALADMLPMRPDVRQPLRDMLREGDSHANVRVDVSDAGAQVQFDLNGLDPMLREGVKAGIEAAKGGGLRPDQTDTFAALVEGIELDDADGDLRIRAPVSMATLSGILGDCDVEDQL